MFYYIFETNLQIFNNNNNNNNNNNDNNNDNNNNGLLLIPINLLVCKVPEVSGILAVY